MRILINRPTIYIDRYDITGDVRILYDDLLPDILEKMHIKYKFLHQRNFRQEKDAIHLSWHLHGTLPNIWHLKTAYLPNYFYFDKYGYGGWSELAKTYNPGTDVDTIRSEVQLFCDNYIANNTSRVIQPKEAFIPQQSYVLVLQQRSSDAVTEFAYIKNQPLLDKVTELYKNSKYKVCTKAHPLADYSQPEEIPITHGADVFVATGSIHKIISGASAVYTVNSGAGFEALMHGKRVFTSGHCDYHWVTDVLKTDDDIRRSKELIEEPVDKDRIIKFLYHALNEHFINIHDDKQIRQRIIKAISEYASS